MNVTKGLVAGVIVGLLSGCSGGGDPPSGPPITFPDANVLPTVSVAPVDTVYESATVKLIGSAQDTDGSVVSLLWTQVSGTAVVIANPNQATASFSAPEVDADETLVFRLTAKDDRDASVSTEVSVSVKDIPILSGISDHSWQMKTILDDSSGEIYQTKTFINENDQAAVVWVQREGSHHVLRAKSIGLDGEPHSAVQDVSPPSLNVSNGGLFNFAYHYDRGIDGAMDGSGNILVSYATETGAEKSLYSAYYDANNGAWVSTTQPLVTGADYHRVSVTESGAYLVSWIQDDHLYIGRVVNNQVVSAKKVSDQIIDLGSFDGDEGPYWGVSVAANSVHLTWSESGVVQHRVWTSDSLSPTTTLSGAGRALNPQIAVSKNGLIGVAWVQSDGNHNSIYAATYDGAWSPPALLEDLGGFHMLSPTVLFDSNNVFHVVYVYKESTFRKMMANEFRDGQWSEAKMIYDLGGQKAILGADGSGQVAAAFVNYHIQYMTYANERWTYVGHLTFLNSGVRYDMSINPSGVGIAAWWDDDRNEGYFAILK